MKKGRVTGWTGSWGEIETEDGEIIWVGYTDIGDPPNEKGYYDLIDGSKVTFKIVKNKYKDKYTGEKSKYKHKAVHVRTIQISGKKHNGLRKLMKQPIYLADPIIIFIKIEIAVDKKTVTPTLFDEKE